MSVTAAANGFVVLLLTVTVVQCENGWDVSYTSTEICAVRGSTVDITCTYTYPSTINNHDTTVQETFWFIKESNGIHVDLRTDPEYSGRVENLCGNNKCTLRISNLRESDSAVYKFRFTTNQPTGSLTGSAGVTLSVTDLHVQVSSSLRDDSLYWAVLRCQSSCHLPDHLNYVWYKNQDETEEGEIFFNIFHRTDRVSCAVKGNEDFRSPSMLVWSQIDWGVSYTSTEICASRGSTVDITCTYTYPSTFNNNDTTVQETFWFIQESNGIHVDLRTDPEYSGRVENLCGNNKCTLRISNLRERDSAVYKFRFTTNQPGGSFTGSAGVTLSVSDHQLQVHVRRSTTYPSSTWTELTCHRRCQLPDHLSYVWYNNNKPVGRKKYFHLRHFNPEDSYHCAIKGQERFPSPTLYAPKPPSVSVSPSGEIMEGSSVTLTCSSDANPAANYTWYKEDEDSPTVSGQNFTITNITSEHGGKYQCEAQNTHGRSKATLHLSVGAGKSVIIMNTIRLTLVVVLVPVLVWTLWTRMKKTLSLKSEVNEAVEMIELDNCPVYENIAAAAQTEDTEEQEDLVCFILCTLFICGGFCCLKSQTRAAATMSVTAAANGFVVLLLTVTVVQCENGWDVSYTSTEICAVRGSTVEITCTYTYPSTINNHDTTVQETFWFIKVSKGNYVDLRTDPEYSGRVENLCGNNKCTLRISNLRESDSAVYKFRFTTNQPGGSFFGSVGVTLSVTDPQLQVHVRRSTANPSSTWTELTCHSRCQLPDHLSYVWYNNNKPVGRRKYFHLRHFNPEDSYHCAIEGQERFPSPTLYYPSDAPKPPSVSVSPSGEIMEGSSVTLTCSSDANPAAKYTWYKRSEDKQVQRLSEETQFVLSSIRSSDSGEYYCTAENELGRSSANIFITVTYAPKPPSVSVSPSGEIMEGSSVTLTCSSDANPAAHYTWYKENRTLLQGPEGVYRLSSISSGDSGVYSCKSENQYGRINSTSLHLDVQYAPKPPSVSVTSSGEIMEGSSVTLTCSSDANPAANYTWYKEDEDSPTASGQIFTIINITAEHGGKYPCEAQNTLGRSKATIHLTVGAGKSVIIMNTIRYTLVVMLVPVLVWTLWTRMKKTLSLKSEVNEAVEMIELDNCPVYENIAAAAQTEDTEEQEDLV
ncbi:hemicentin-1-like [Platichthys flesus]|uniref:hemicentin-1-like n=1 Tax=Platichthys flesus TaxID=8260 RepID=UPI002DBE1BAA|nr:hemicentin-1-like [Platichthys flesus]